MYTLDSETRANLEEALVVINRMIDIRGGFEEAVIIPDYIKESPNDVLLNGIYISYARMYEYQSIPVDSLAKIRALILLMLSR